MYDKSDEAYAARADLVQKFLEVWHEDDALIECLDQMLNGRTKRARRAALQWYSDSLARPSSKVALIA